MTPGTFCTKKLFLLSAQNGRELSEAMSKRETFDSRQQTEGSIESTFCDGRQQIGQFLSGSLRIISRGNCRLILNEPIDSVPLSDDPTAGPGGLRCGRLAHQSPRISARIQVKSGRHSGGPMRCPRFPKVAHTSWIMKTAC